MKEKYERLVAGMGCIETLRQVQLEMIGEGGDYATTRLPSF